MTPFDYIIIAAYFVFMLLIGAVFSKHTKNTSDYFRGGGAMTWWLVGASSFVQTFSAWSFVGLAGACYSRGSLLAWIFISNIFGGLICILFTAARFRRLRVITWVEAMRERYGVPTEQFYAYVNLIQGFIYGGSGLYVLSVFMAAMFGIDVKITIIVVGIVVTLMSVSGGSWAVTASDFVQSLVIMAVIIVTAILTLNHPAVGGISGFISKVPATHMKWGFDVCPSVLWLWLFLGMVNSILNMNGLSGGAARLIVVKDEKSAVKSMYIPMIGYLFLPFLVLIPSLAATFMFDDLATLYPQLNFPKEAAYAAVAMKVLPTGMAGLLACAMFAASMSSMDTALNRNAGIFVKNIYQRMIRPQCGEKEAMTVAKLFTFILGIILILSGLKFSEFKELPIFELGALIGSLLAQPMLIPLVLALFIKKVPSWTAASTVVVGFIVAILTMKVIPVTEIAESFIGTFNKQDTFDMSWMIPNLMVTLACFGWFFFTMLFYRDPDPNSQRARNIESFFHKQRTPIDLKAEDIVESDGEQAKTLGWLSLAYGIFILLGIFIPNDFGGRMVFFSIGAGMSLVGIVLLYAGTKRNRAADVELKDSNDFTPTPIVCGEDA